MESILPEPKMQNLVSLGLVNNLLVKHWEAAHTRSDLRSVTPANALYLQRRGRAWSHLLRIPHFRCFKQSKSFVYRSNKRVPKLNPG